uniref:Uncharacterized protein n=1 Tax=Ditylenchus dipsaci TaxID=166011 RepID=A0A915EFX1_9BILA
MSTRELAHLNKNVNKVKQELKSLKKSITNLQEQVSQLSISLAARHNQDHFAARKDYRPRQFDHRQYHRRSRSRSPHQHQRASYRSQSRPAQRYERSQSRPAIRGPEKFAPRLTDTSPKEPSSSSSSDCFSPKQDEKDSKENN